jgi:hypothetical protein
VSERYKVKKVAHYEVVDTEGPKDDNGNLPIHFNGKNEDLAEQLAADMNENHQNLVNAQEAIQAAAVQVSDSGDGEDAVG